MKTMLHEPDKVRDEEDPHNPVDENEGAGGGFESAQPIIHGGVEYVHGGEVGQPAKHRREEHGFREKQHPSLTTNSGHHSQHNKNLGTASIQTD